MPKNEVQELLEEYDMSPYDVAAALPPTIRGSSAPTIYRYLKGEAPPAGWCDVVRVILDQTPGQALKRQPIQYCAHCGQKLPDGG